MRYERWGEKVSKHLEWDHANAERIEEHSESQDQLNEVSQVVSLLSETGIEKSVERVQSAFDDELSAIKEERSEIEVARTELRTGITEDMENLEQTAEKLQSLQRLSGYGKQFLRTQLRCNKISLQLNKLLIELNYKESSKTEIGIIQLGREYALIHAKVNALCEAGWQVEDTIDNIDAKKLTMPMEERRRRGENYVNEIVDVYRDNLLDRGATDGETLARKVAELRAHYSAELEKDLAGLPNELYTDPDYEQIMAKLTGEQSRESTDQASATNSQERRSLSPDQDNVFVRGQSAVNRSLLSMFPSRRAEMIDSSYVGASPEVVGVINKHIGELKGITEIKQYWYSKASSSLRDWKLKKVFALRKRIIKKVVLLSLILAVALSALITADAAGEGNTDFVLLSDVVPDAILEIRYYSTYNFVGERIDGYEEPVALLSKEAAEALRAVSDDLLSQGYGILIYTKT